MANLVLYRKYRPQKFTDIVGQAHVVQTLQNALATDEVAHAYLFTGPRGTGKTTIARILAKSLGTNAIDLIEIDAASNRSIDDIRELRDGIRIVPTQSDYKVFIIDEVHMLTKEAFNALLKTLEEPPSHAIFILATTEAHKIPPTIISRCQRFDFHPVTQKDLKKRLTSVLKKEERSVSDETLNLILAGADGSVRNAESLLGNILVLGDNPDILHVRALLGLPDMQKVGELMNLVLAQKKNDALTYLASTYKEGTDLEQFTKGIVRYMRGLMFAKVSPEIMEEAVADIPEAMRSQFITLSQSLEEEKIYGIIRKFMDAENEMKYASYQHVPLELAVVEACQS